MLFMNLKILKVFDDGVGICGNLYHNSDITKDERMVLEKEMSSFIVSKGWHSGSHNFPLAHGDKSPSDAYHDDNIPMWSVFTQYGRRRRAVMDHLDRHLLRIRDENTTN